jgi:hypothetical protein
MLAYVKDIFVAFNLDPVRSLPLRQRGPTGGPRATSGPRPLVTRPSKLFVTY